MKILILQQQPIKMRYSEWWGKYFKSRFDECCINSILINDVPVLDIANDESIFTSSSIEYELTSLKQLFDVYEDGDKVLILDHSYPGFSCNLATWINPDDIYVYCHATPINNKDIFSDISGYKWGIEKAFLNKVNTVFVSTEYHKQKLVSHGVASSQINVVGILPPKMLYDEYIHNNREFLPFHNKKSRVLVPTRISPQKIDDNCFRALKESGIPYDVVFINTSWWNYYYNMDQYKVVLSLALEETYGYAMAEALLLDSVPICPNDYAYKELYPQYILYSNYREMLNVIEHVMNEWDQKNMDQLYIDANLKMDKCVHSIIKALNCKDHCQKTCRLA